MTLNAASVDPCQDIVTRQLDDVNVLGEALITAFNDKDDVRVATIRATLDRYALAMGWSRDKVIPAVVTYADALAGGDEDLFAPAFILRSIAPDRAETATLAAKISQDVRALLARL